MRQELTLLQRAMIQRLRERGFVTLAELACEAWRKGESLSIREPAEYHSNLVTDLPRANGEVRLAGLDESEHQS